MTPSPLTLSRRMVLAGAAASLALPRFARAQQTGAAMRLRCRFADQDFTYRLLDNATARDLVSLLPLGPDDRRLLDQREDRPSAAPAGRGRHTFLSTTRRRATSATSCGWGNLAFFHDSYVYRDDLIRLGRIEGGVEPLLVRGEFPLRLELLS